MAANLTPHPELMGAQFYNASETPAWHELGVNDPTAHTVAEAITRLDGNFDVTKRQLSFVSGGKVVHTDFHALVRSPMKGDPQERIIGTPVTKDFEVFTPAIAAELWDKAIRDEHGNRVPVETYRRGQTKAAVKQMIAGDRGGRIMNADRLAMAVDRWDTIVDPVKELSLQYTVMI